MRGCDMTHGFVCTCNNRHTSSHIPDRIQRRTSARRRPDTVLGQDATPHFCLQPARVPGPAFCVCECACACACACVVCVCARAPAHGAYVCVCLICLCVSCVSLASVRVSFYACSVCLCMHKSCSRICETCCTLMSIPCSRKRQATLDFR